MSELYLISCVHFKCGMWALNPHSLNPAKCINNYAKSIHSWLRCFQFDMGVKKWILTLFRSLPSMLNGTKSIHMLHIHSYYWKLGKGISDSTHILFVVGGDFTTWHPFPLYYTQLYLSYVKVLRRIQICVQRNSFFLTPIPNLFEKINSSSVIKLMLNGDLPQFSFGPLLI